MKFSKDVLLSSGFGVFFVFPLIGRDFQFISEYNSTDHLLGAVIAAFFIGLLIGVAFSEQPKNIKTKIQVYPFVLTCSLLVGLSNLPINILSVFCFTLFATMVISGVCIKVKSKNTHNKSLKQDK